MCTLLTPRARSLAVRLPFPLTLRFKLMLQRGIDTPDMDVSWVSSISWYFLCLFGLNAVFRLILGDDNGEWPPLSQPLTLSPPDSRPLPQPPTERATWAVSQR